MIESATMVSSILLGTLHEKRYGCYLLRSFEYPQVVWCCVLLGVVAQSRKQVRLRANGRNNSQQCWELFRPPARSLRTRVNENAPKMAIFKKAAQVLTY